jgi:aspartate aminotransferase
VLQDFVLSRLQRIPDVKVATPQGAFYVLPDVSAYYGKSPPDGSQVVSFTLSCNLAWLVMVCKAFA